MSRFECLDRNATQGQFGELVGISQQAVSDLLRRRVLREGGTLAQWLLDYTAHLRAQAAGRGGDEQGELVKARIRESLANAMSKEVTVGKDMDLLIYEPDIEPAMRNWVAQGHQSVTAAIERITEGIESEFGVTLEERHVREHLHAVLRDLASYPAKLAAAIEQDLEGLRAA